MVESSITIDAPAEVVWRFLIAPEAALITSDDVVQVFRVPGTPVDQPGEQVIVLREAAGHLEVELHEVVTFEPTSRLVTVCRSVPVENWGARMLERAPLGGTHLRSQLSVTMNNDFIVPALFAPENQEVLWEELRRIKRAIESGVQFPSQRDGPGK